MELNDFDGNPHHLWRSTCGVRGGGPHTHSPTIEKRAKSLCAGRGGHGEAPYALQPYRAQAPEACPKPKGRHHRLSRKVCVIRSIPLLYAFIDFRVSSSWTVNGTCIPCRSSSALIIDFSEFIDFKGRGRVRSRRRGRRRCRLRDAWMPVEGLPRGSRSEVFDGGVTPRGGGGCGVTPRLWTASFLLRRPPGQSHHRARQRAGCISHHRAMPPDRTGGHHRASNGDLVWGG